MDERSNRYLLLITCLVIGVLTLAVLAIEQTPLGTSVERATANWPVALLIAFNVIVLLAAAVIAVGYFDWAPLMKFLGLGIACKAVLTLLTAVGYVFTSKQAPFTSHLEQAALGSLVASVVHAIGVVVLVSWALRELVMGRHVGLGSPPEGIILPTEGEAEVPQPQQAPEPFELEPTPSYEAMAAPTPSDEIAATGVAATGIAATGVAVTETATPEPAAPESVPTGGEEEGAEEEEDLDRVVAAATPVTAELEALPDQPADETESEAAETEELEEIAEPELEPSPSEIESAHAAEQPEPRPREVEEAPVKPSKYTGQTLRFTVEEILGCFRPEDLALSAEQVRSERGDEEIRVPFEIALPQIEEGAVRVDPDTIFSQLPRRAFRQSPEEIKGHLWRGLLELPLDRVIAQVPPQVLVRTYAAEQPAAAEFGEPFTDSLAEGGEQPEPRPGGAAVEPEAQPAEAAPVSALEEIEPAWTPSPIEGVAALEPVPHPRSASLPATLRVNAEYVIAQFPGEATAMPIEDIEAKLRPHGKLLVPADDVLGQLAEGYVAIDVTQLLEQLPPGAIAMSWSDLHDALPGGKVRLPLDEIVRQLPRDALTPEMVQQLQDAAEEVPEPFHEAGAAEAATLEPAGEAPAGEAPGGEAPASEAPGAEEQLEPATTSPETVPQAEPGAPQGPALEIAWREILPQFPADAFSVSRDQIGAALEGKSARIDMNLVRPQLGEGRVTVPCGYLLAQFPDEYLELSVEEVTERMPDGRFELPLVSVILQLPEEELSLPGQQVLQDSTDKIPTIFIDSMAQALEETEETTEAAEPAEPVEQAAAAPDETTEEPALVAAEAGELTEGDIDEIEGMLDEKRRKDPGTDEDAEFIDDAFATDDEEEETSLLAEPVAGEELLPEQEEAAFAEPEQEAAPTEIEAEAPSPGEQVLAGDEPIAIEETEPAPEAEQIGAPAGEWSAPEEIETAPAPMTAEDEIEATPEQPAEDAVEAPAVETAEAPTPAPVVATGVDLTAAAHRSDAYRRLLHDYARFHIEHGHVCVERGRPVFAFAPAETSAEALALELPPRLAEFEQLLRCAGCGPLERAVLTAGAGTIVCQWLPATTATTLAMFATTDKQAAGMMHLQVRRDAATLSELSAQLWSRPAPGAVAPAGATAPPGAAPCEVVRPDGGASGEIANLLAAFNVKTVAQLRFHSGAPWMLASSVAFDDAAISGQPCCSPSDFAELPEALRLGRIESVLAVAGDHVVTLNAPDRPGEPGLICIFPSEFREGLLRMKAEKASAVLCAV